MKKRLSRKYYTIEIVMLAAGLFLAWRLPFIFKQYQTIDNILLPFLGVLLVWFSIFLIRNTLIIEFDNNYLYLTRGKKSIVLPLSHITAIKAAISGHMELSQFMLEYLDADAKTFSLHFAPKQDGSLKQFVELVKAQNPQVDYQPYSKFFWQN